VNETFKVNQHAQAYEFGKEEIIRMSQTLRAYLTGIALLLVWTGGAMAQTPTESDRARKAALQMARGHEIPAATLPCSLEEAKWWEDLRAAGKAVQETRGGKKEREKFLRLLQQGQENSYQPPIPDSRVIVLSKVPPRYNEEARRRNRSGTVALVVELRPDGFVGEVEIVQGLGSGLDEDAAEAARRTIFLPPVKDRKFVSFHMPMTMSFNIY
jgi:TonB family protein